MIGLAFLSALLIGLAMMALFWGLGQNLQESESVKQRLDVISPTSMFSELDARPKKTKRKGLGIFSGLFNHTVSEHSLTMTMATDLARANMSFTVNEWLMVRATCIALPALLLLLILKQPLFAMLGGILGFFAPNLYLGQRQKQRLVAFQNQLPDLLTLLIGSLRSGYGMTIAMDTVAKNMPPPASEEFARVVREIGLGVTSAQALNNLVRRIHSDDLDLMVTAIAIQHEVGGNLANILETISDTIRERIRLQGQLRALTSQPNMTRYILTALPLGLGGIIFLMNRTYMLGLFLPGPTLAIPIGAGVLLVMGYLVMGKLGKIEL